VTARAPQPDRGAGTILVLAVGLLLIAAGVAGSAVGAGRVGRHQARTAADLGALAGAVRVIDGRPAACAQASRLVAANDAALTFCDVDGLEIVIYVEVVVTPLPGLTRRAREGARAGPVYSVGE
jgi:secretion/DNA translocation related TadE-like protein